MPGAAKGRRRTHLLEDLVLQLHIPCEVSQLRHLYAGGVHRWLCRSAGVVMLLMARSMLHALTAFSEAHASCCVLSSANTSCCDDFASAAGKERRTHPTQSRRGAHLWRAQTSQACAAVVQRRSCARSVTSRDEWWRRGEWWRAKSTRTVSGLSSWVNVRGCEAHLAASRSSTALRSRWLRAACSRR